MPKLSVIIPIYGVEKYIERCVRSLFEQTLNDIEFIFVDDCTPDRSIDILNEICNEYQHRLAEERKNVRIVRMSSNSGQAAVRRTGIQLAEGEYIIHCDSDDWVEVTAYEKMYNKAVAENCDIVVCDYYLSDGINHNEKKHQPSFIYSDKLLYFSKLLRGEASTSVWTKMVRRELYKNKSVIFPEYNMWEDYVLSVQLVSYSSKVGYIDECLYYYYFNPSSICNSNIDRNQQQIMNNASIILSFLSSLKVSTNDIICFKQNARYELSKHVGVYKYWRMWHNTFPEITVKYIFIKDVHFRERMRFLCIYIGLYPFVLKILSIRRRFLAH